MRASIKITILIVIIMVGVAILMYLISNSKSSYKPSRNDHRGLQSLNNVTAPNPGAVYSVIVEDDAVYAPQIGFGNEVIRQNKNNDKFSDMFIASGGTVGRYPGGTPSNYWDWKTGRAISSDNQCVYVNTNTDNTTPVGSLGTLPLNTCEAGGQGWSNTNISSYVGPGDRCWCNVNGDNISGYPNSSWALQNDYGANYIPGKSCDLMCLDAAKISNKIIDHPGPVISPGQCAVHCWNNPNCKSWQYKNPSISSYVGPGDRCWCKVNGENVSGYPANPTWALQNGYTGTGTDCENLCAGTKTAQYGNCILSSDEASQTTDMTYCAGNNPRSGDKGTWKILQNFANGGIYEPPFSLPRKYAYENPPLTLKSPTCGKRSCKCTTVADCVAIAGSHSGNLACINFSRGIDASGTGSCGEGCIWTLNDWINYVNTIANKGGKIDTIFDLNILSSSMEYQLDMLDTAQKAGIPIKYIELGNEIYHNYDTANVYGNIGGRTPDEVYNANGSSYQIDMQRWLGILKKKYPSAQIALVGGSSGIVPSWNQTVFEYSGEGVRCDPSYNANISFVAGSIPSNSRMNTVTNPASTCLTPSSMMADAATLHIYAPLVKDNPYQNFQTINKVITDNQNIILYNIPDNLYIWITEMAWDTMLSQYWMTGLCVAQLIIGLSIIPRVGSVPVSDINSKTPIKTGIINPYSFISGNPGDALTMDTSSCTEDVPTATSPISFTWNGFIQSTIFNAFKTDSSGNHVALHSLGFTSNDPVQYTTLAGCKLNIAGGHPQNGTGAIILNLSSFSVAIPSESSPLLNMQPMTWKAAYPGDPADITSSTPTIYTKTGIETSASNDLYMEPYSIYISDPQNLHGFPSPNCTISAD